MKQAHRRPQRRPQYRWNTLLLLPVTLLALTACGLFGPSEPGPDPDPGESRLRGLVEVAFRDLGPGQESTLTARSGAAPEGLRFTAVESGSLTKGDSRYAYATFSIDNNSGEALENLTFYAVSDDATIAGTAVKAIRDGSGAALNDAAVARDLRPTHRMTEADGSLAVVAADADLQAFTSSEAASVDEQLGKEFDAAAATVLEYGFVAHTASGNRTIPSGASGRVTFAFRVPYDADAAEAQPTSFTFTFAVADEGPSYVTRSLEEDPARVTDACTRAAAVGSSQVVVIATAPASTPQGCSYTKLDKVIYAAASGSLAAAYLTPVGSDPGDPERPSVVYITPAQGATEVPRDEAVAVDVALVESVSLDDTTFAGNVTLRRVSDDAPVDGNFNPSGAGNNIVFQPSGLLEENTRYRFEVTDGVKDFKGRSVVPFSSTFTTGRLPLATEPKFTVSEVATGGPFTSLTLGPDGRLYASTFGGSLMRWNVAADGTLSNPQSYDVKPGRVIIGLVFDPQRNDPNGETVLWITHNAPVPPPNGEAPPAPSFSGAVARITFQDLQNGPFSGTLQEYIEKLPRSAKDHLTNSLAFGPDGFLYVSQGSNSSKGAPDEIWANRPERLLNAAILRIDPDLPEGQLPVNVQTEDHDGVPGDYDPYAPGAPVTIYATGVRNAYDLVWHSNGRLYVPTNGSGGGGNAPATPPGHDPQAPAITNGPVMNDYLFDVVEGGYYGHPNPLRDEYVLFGGNPTSGVDPGEVVGGGPYNGYPVGTQPERNYRGFIYDYGPKRSANGAVEYTSNAFGASFRGKLLVVEYSKGDDVIANDPGANADGGHFSARAAGEDAPNGQIRAFGGPGAAGAQLLQLRADEHRQGGLDTAATGEQVVAGLDNPLDITMGFNGNLYVAEFASFTQGRISLLKPVGN